MHYKCPRTKHLMSLEVCAARKAARRHGCATCMTPAQVIYDEKRLESLAVGFDLAAKGKDKRQPYYLRLDGRTTRMSRRVAQEVVKRIQAALDAHK
jgi:hypothetical protein